MLGGYEFTILYDLYDERINQEGEPEFRLKKKGLKRKWFVSDLNYITDIREIPTKTGKLFKNKCEVYHRNEAKWTQIEGNYNTLKEILKEDTNKVTGFYGSKSQRRS